MASAAVGHVWCGEKGNIYNAELLIDGQIDSLYIFTSKSRLFSCKSLIFLHYLIRSGRG